MGKTDQQIGVEADKRRLLHDVKPLCGAVITTGLFDSAVKGARVKQGLQLNKLTILVRSNIPTQNVTNKRARRHATRYVLGPCRAITVAGTTGGVKKVRFQEIDGDGFVVVIKPIGSEHWRVCSTYKKPSGRSAGERTRGHGAERSTS